MTTPTPTPTTALTYLYRDAANYKAFATILLAGTWTDADTATLRATMVDATWFVPARVGLPSLRPALEVWSDGPTGDDHDFHELVDLLPATPEQRADVPIHSTTAAFLGVWAATHPTPQNHAIPAPSPRLDAPTPNRQDSRAHTAGIVGGVGCSR